MLKTNKGVTILALVITIILLLILSGISLNTGFSVMKEVRLGRIISDMTLVQTKVNAINEEYHFYNQDTDCFVGAGPYKIDNTTYQIDNIQLVPEEIKLIAQEASVSESEVFSWDWYQWDASILESQGLDKAMLGENEFFYVNYENGEILYSKGTSDDHSNDFYSMTGLNHMIKNTK